MAPPEQPGGTGRASRVIGRRLVAMAWIRGILVVGVSLFLVTTGRDLVLPGNAPLATVTLLVMLVFTAAVPLWPASAHRAVLDLSVVVDAGGIAILVILTGGVVSPFTPLAVLVVALQLLAFGTRTGLRIGLATSVALGWVWATGAPEVTGSASGALHPDVRMLVTLLAIWTAVASVAVLTRVVEADLRLAAANVDAIHAIGRALEPETGPAGVAGQVAQAVTGRLGVPSASFWLISEETGDLVLTAWSQGGQLAEPVPEAVLSTNGLVAEALETPSAVLLPTAGPLSRLHDDHALAVRLVSPRDELRGLLAVGLARQRRHARVDAHVRRAVEEIARDAGGAIEDARHLVHLRQQARTDPVTGVPNHRALQERLRSELARAERRWEHGEPAAVSLVLFDLDRFKVVNDTHGHPTGDAVLASIAEAVDRATRAGDILCRYGGEEFAVVLADTGPGEAGQAAERFRGVVSRVRVRAPDGTPVGVTASFGVASVIGPGTDRSRLVDLADEALYRAKRNGRDRVVALDAALPRATPRRAS